VRLQGIIVPLITPLTDDGEPDEPALARLIEHAIAGGVSGLFLFGSSGEGPLLTDATKERLTAAAVDCVGGRVPVLVTASAPGTRPSLELARRLLRRGGDALVVASPYYFTPSQDEIFDHVAAIARNVDAPTIVYNIPQATRTMIEADTLLRAAELPEVIAIKDSSGDMAHFQRVLRINATRPEFSVFQGAEGVVGLSILRGAAGGVLGVANVAPALCVELYEAARARDLARIWALQEQLTDLGRLYTHSYWLAGLKAAVAQLGLCTPTVSLPFAPATPEAQAAIRRDMAAAGLL